MLICQLNLFADGFFLVVDKNDFHEFKKKNFFHWNMEAVKFFLTPAGSASSKVWTCTMTWSD